MRWMGAMAALLAAGAAGAQDYEERPLAGTWFAGPAELHVDGASGPVTHLWLRITGEAAEALWAGMGGRPERDECLGLEVKVNRAGLFCEHDPALPGAAGYACSFGLDMRRGRIASARGPC